MMPMAVAHVLNKKDCIKQKKKMVLNFKKNLKNCTNIKVQIIVICVVG
jgi:hypothetical protein